MRVNLAKRILASALALQCLFIAPASFAASGEQVNELSTEGPRKHVTYIIFAGLAGAVMGLSTLSFYGRPQDRLSNIAVGFAIGVIGGALYTTYKAATEPKDFYGLREGKPEAWTLMDQASMRLDPAPTPTPALVFEF